MSTLCSRRRRCSALPLCLLLLCAVGLVTASRTAATDAALRGDVVRFHVIAEGDSEAEQARKLAVRDALLPEVQSVLQRADTAAEAQSRLAAALPALAKLGAETYARVGGTGAVTVALGQADYPLRESNGLALPAGTYASLRVTLGAGAGHNWWCVLFPDLSETTPDTAAETAVMEGLSPAEAARMASAEEGYRLRLFCVDWLEKLLGGIVPLGAMQ